MPLRIGDVKRRTVKFLWPDRPEIPDEDKAVFVLREPSPLRYRALTDQYVTYRTETDDARRFTLKIANTQLMIDLITECVVDVQNVEYNGKPVQITEDNKRNKLMWMLETNMGLDREKYGTLLDDLFTFINEKLVPVRREQSVAVEVGSEEGN